MPRRDVEAKSVSAVMGGMRAEYAMARESRFRRKRPGVSSTPHGGDWHLTDTDYFKMVELARAFDRDDCIVGQGVTRLIDNVVQEGFALDCQTGNRDIDARLKAKWLAWGADKWACHDAGELTWNQIEHLALRHVIVDGDVLALPVAESGTLATVENHRLRTPTRTKQNVCLGILRDERRRPLEYWLTRDDVGCRGSVPLVRDIKAYPARDEDGHPGVFHIYNPVRFTLGRGITAFARIVDTVGMHDDIQFAKLVQQQVTSCFAIIREMGLAGGVTGDAATGEQSTETLGDGSTRTLEGVSPGLVIRGAPGEKITGFSPNVPNAEFFQHATLILSFIAVNLGIPVAVLLLDPSNTNFSGWRGAMDQARYGFRRIQRWYQDALHRPVYLWKVRQWLVEDEELAKAVAAAQEADPSFDVFGHRWNCPTWDYIEPLNDSTADTLQQRQLLNSPRRIQAKKGREFEEIAFESVEDNGFVIIAAKKKAQEINDEFDDGHPVTWRDCLSLPLPDMVSVSVQGGTPATAPAAEKPNAAA